MSSSPELPEAELTRLMATPPPPIPADGDTILRRVALRRRLNRAAAAVGVVALLLIGQRLRPPPPADLTPRGLDANAVVLELGWLVEGEGVSRAVDAGVAPHQRVIFRVQTSRAGFLCLAEQGPGGDWMTLFPDPGGAWSAERGDSLLSRDGTAMAFRTDLGPGVRAYRLGWSETAADCGAASVYTEAEIEWLD